VGLDLETLSDGVDFTDEGHTYTSVETGKELTSVTTFLKRFFKEFPEDMHVKYADSCNEEIISFVNDGKSGRRLKKIFGEDWQEAAKNMYSHEEIVTSEFIKGVWNANSEEASSHGTRVHNALEAYAKGEDYESFLEFPEDWAKFKAGKEFLDSRLTHDKVYTELQLSSDELGLAGTVDLVFKVGDSVYLVDWKTNESIDSSGFGGEMARGPLKEFPDCNLTKYCAQLMLYQYLFELEGVEVLAKSIVHLREDGFEQIVVPEEFNSELAESLLRYGGRL
jgi:hypothetical protein